MVNEPHAARLCGAGIEDVRTHNVPESHSPSGEHELIQTCEDRQLLLPVGYQTELLFQSRTPCYRHAHDPLFRAHHKPSVVKMLIISIIL